MVKRLTQLLVISVFVPALFSCVSTEELYAEYDAADCRLVAETDADGSVELHEQISNKRFPWEPAVYFAFDSSELTAEEKARLDRSMLVVQHFSALQLGLQGFTDKRGSNTYNLALAERRVNAVRQYLIERGLDANRIALQPIGEALPQIGADDDTARAVNRRVELMLLQRDGRPQPVEYAVLEQ